ncbi:vitamin K epoxide reductase complex subunit 1 [Zerene cesonia]|uniref:vitamin K epoxide reductase complex subunit 1 n=1 Tax=Zerene cesonia TaxID=33412 RepID=UPI0018E59C9D|nr:vitamin K epoxide reductase complex subunit 1 [Zerene cesonia]XP_038209607.1 vitamin K epoxide reductase complex subunit 1 [Zerene cesonia]XP_038209608.1 vitamin K epoxide reductase complex subunit 1 [Zerene cesonia]XP_038209609.1 vitamin K epoxide reductase complex subunit 1 [Zerene cesonia]
MTIKGINRGIVSAGILGILVSTYALYVEMAAESRPGYKALCDIAERASCSKVLTSEYSKGFGLVAKNSAFEVPNCVYGIAFYCIMIFLSTYDNLYAVRLQVVLGISSLISCVYLAYLLIFVLGDFCIVCVSTYFVNAAITYVSFKKHSALKSKIA